MGQAGDARAAAGSGHRGAGTGSTGTSSHGPDCATHSPPLPSRPAPAARPSPPHPRGAGAPAASAVLTRTAAVPAARRRCAPAAPGRAQERTASRTASRAAAHRPLGGGMHRHRDRDGRCTPPGLTSALALHRTVYTPVLHCIDSGTTIAPAPHRHQGSPAQHGLALGSRQLPGTLSSCREVPRGLTQAQTPNSATRHTLSCWVLPGAQCREPPSLLLHPYPCTHRHPASMLHPTAHPASCTPPSPHPIYQHRPCTIHSQTRYWHEAPRLTTGNSHCRHDASPSSFLHEFQSTWALKIAMLQRWAGLCPASVVFTLFAPKILPQRLQAAPTALPGGQRLSHTTQCDCSTAARSSLTAWGAGTSPSGARVLQSWGHGHHGDMD